MKLSSDLRSAASVTAVGEGFIDVGGVRYQRSLLLRPERVDAGWGPQQNEELAAPHLAALADVTCDVLLLGTGARQRFPLAAWLRPLIAAGRGVEVMDTAAACRTYNILLAEGRAVAAALVIDAPLLNNAAA